MTGNDTDSRSEVRHVKWVFLERWLTHGYVAFCVVLRHVSYVDICITVREFMNISWPVHNNSSVACDATHIKPFPNLQLCILPSADNCILTCGCT